MNFLQLECFVSIAKNKSFTEAANEILLSQSSLSKHIVKLEIELGIKLFNRNTRNIALTIAGEEFLQHAKVLLDEYYNTLKKVQLYSNSYSINIGSIEHMSKVRLTAPIASFLDKFPSVDINIKQGDTICLMDMLISYKIDMAFIAHIIYPFLDSSNISNISNYPLDNLDLYTLVEDEYYLVVNKNHKLASKTKIDWTELANEKLVILGSRYSLNTVIKTTLKYLNVPAKIVFESNQVDTILGLINENYGVSLLSKKVAMGNDNLTTLSIDNPIRRNTAIVIRKDTVSSGINKKFVEHILSYYNNSENLETDAKHRAKEQKFL